MYENGWLEVQIDMLLDRVERGLPIAWVAGDDRVFRAVKQEEAAWLVSGTGDGAVRASKFLLVAMVRDAIGVVEVRST